MSLIGVHFVVLSLATSPPPACGVSLRQHWDKRKLQRCGSENPANCEGTLREPPWVDTPMEIVGTLGSTHDRFWGRVLQGRVPALSASSVPRGVVGLNALCPFAIIKSGLVVSLRGHATLPQGQRVCLDEDRTRVSASWPDGGGRNGHS